MDKSRREMLLVEDRRIRRARQRERTRSRQKLPRRNFSRLHHLCDSKPTSLSFTKEHPRQSRQRSAGRREWTFCHGSLAVPRGHRGRLIMHRRHQSATLTHNLILGKQGIFFDNAFQSFSAPYARHRNFIFILLIRIARRHSHSARTGCAGIRDDTLLPRPVTYCRGGAHLVRRLACPSFRKW